MKEPEDYKQLPYRHTSMTFEEPMEAFVEAIHHLQESFYALTRMLCGEEDFENEESAARELKTRYDVAVAAMKNAGLTYNAFIEAHYSMRRKLFSLGVIGALQKADRLDLLEQFPDAQAVYATIEAQSIANELPGDWGWDFTINPPD